MASKKPLLSLELKVKKGLFSALKQSSRILENKIRENAGETDHSLDDLEKLGHPYSAAHPKALHDPNYLIHRQSSTLYEAIETQIVNQFVSRVGVNEDIAPYVVHVVFGTKFMIPRDFITESFNETREEIIGIIEKELNKNLK